MGFAVWDTFRVWMAAVASEYLPLADLVAWADDQIPRRDPPPRWLLNVSLAPTPDAAASALRRALDDNIQRFGDGGEPSLHPARLYIGFLYLRVGRGDLPLGTALAEAGYEADAVAYKEAGGVVGVGTQCEVFFALLTELERGSLPEPPTDRPLAKRVAAVFEPYARLARGQLHLLPQLAAAPEAAPSRGAVE
jgi:hypothetical protein